MTHVNSNELFFEPIISQLATEIKKDCKNVVKKCRKRLPYLYFNTLIINTYPITHSWKTLKTLPNIFRNHQNLLKKPEYIGSENRNNVENKAGNCHGDLGAGPVPGEKIMAAVPCQVLFEAILYVTHLFCLFGLILAVCVCVSQEH